MYLWHSVILRLEAYFERRVCFAFGVSIFTIAIVFFGCSNQSEKKVDSHGGSESPDTDMSSVSSERQPLELEKMADEEKLLLFKKVPTGMTYKETKFLLPTLGELVTEGGGSFNPRFGLFEARLELSLIGQSAKMEFNFKNDTLYGYDFFISKLDSGTAEVIYTNLQSFYSKHFGPYNEEIETFEYFYEASYWSSDSIHWGITKNIYSKTNAYVGWGY